MKQRFFVNLQGGIGNQLFQVCSGLYYAKRYEKDLHLILGSKKIYSIFSLLSKDNFKVVYKNESVINIFMSRVFNRILKKSKILSFISGIHNSKEVGYDVSLSINPSFKEIRGYYQTYLYLDEVRDELISTIEIKNFSDWYWKQKIIINSASRPIMMHVRRGDYSKHNNTFGLLSIEYYKSAINYLQESNFTGPIWIFSDDIEIATSFAELIDENTHIVNPPHGTSASESMALMWEFSAHIIANSTFSWWGAILSPNSKIVIAPEPWFMNELKIKNLIPPDWIKIDSAWEN
jgi:hypothetical protein